MARAVIYVLIALLLPAQALPDTRYLEGKKAFRREIERKKIYSIGHLTNVKAVLFDSDKGRFTFSMSDGEKAGLEDLVEDFLGVSQTASLNIMAEDLSEGKIIVAREYRKGSGMLKGAQMRTCLLIPRVPYYHRISTMENAWQTYSVHNITASFVNEDSDAVLVGFYQPEGTFFGITRAATVPMKSMRKPKENAVYFSMPTQEEMNAALAGMAPLSPGRTGLKEKFIDKMRQHPYYSEKNGSEGFAVDDGKILLVLDTLTAMAEKCTVRDTSASFKVHEGFKDFHVVEYSLVTMANVDAIFPDIPFLQTIVERIAQAVSEEVSWKYLSLSMKNLRDKVIEDNAR